MKWLVWIMLLAQSPDADVGFHAEQDVGPLSVHVDCERTTVGLADAVRVIVTIVAPADVVVKQPVFERLPAECPVVDVVGNGPDEIESKFGRLMARSWIIRFEPMRSGEFELGRAPIEYSRGSPDWRAGEIELPRIRVLTESIGPADSTTLYPPPDLPSESTRFPPSRILWWAGVALVVSTLVAAAVLRWLGAAPASPLESGLADLRRLEASHLLTEGRFREFAERACQVVRVYLEGSFDLRAPKQSTPQFLADPRTHAALNESQRSALAEFLEAADIEKFAIEEPNIEQCRRCLRRARALLADELAR